MGSGALACGIFAGLVIVLSSSVDNGQLAVAFSIFASIGAYVLLVWLED